MSRHIFDYDFFPTRLASSAIALEVNLLLSRVGCLLASA
jgi:hypothetical protein